MFELLSCELMTTAVLGVVFVEAVGVRDQRSFTLGG